MTPGTWNTGYKGMTLLHLASALGYSKLVCTMLGWRADNPSVILETEIDALSQDNLGYTPLVNEYLVFVSFDFEVAIDKISSSSQMWSCARGHQETATILYKWNYDALNIKNRSHQTPVEVAKMNGYVPVCVSPSLSYLDF